VTFSTAGGAGKVAVMLAAAQRTLGWDAEVFHVTSSNLHSDPFELPIHTLLAGIDNCIIRKPGFKSLISLSRDKKTVPLPELLKSADVVHLHWINGVTRLSQIRQSAPSARIVMTLHDMNPFTGTCHQSFGCTQFRDRCQECPAVRAFARKAVESRLAQKTLEYKSDKDLVVVAPTEWVRNLAKTSSALGDQDIHVIPNPVGDEFLLPQPPAERELAAAEGTSEPRFCLIANDLKDPLKNVEFAVQALSIVRESVPNATLRLIGQNGEAFEASPGVIYLGQQSGPSVRAELNQAEALLIPSLGENAPMVVLEAASLGVPVIGKNIPSLESMLADLPTCATVESVKDMARSMEALVLAKARGLGQSEKNSLRTLARESFSSRKVAAQYLTLYGKGS